MKILLDTHVLLWAFCREPMLTGKAVAYIEDEDNEIYYSTVSLWEIAIKHAQRPDEILVTPAQFRQYCLVSGYLPLPVRDEHVLALDTLNRPDDLKHNDPFDRMLLAQAKSEGMLLMTHDRLITQYREDFIVAI